ncbi:mitochondrial ribosomal protein subunit L20-domain-containing protein [Achaetomium macrosporum]|uniref:Mitochondrial ribosomal protein subunit L20-domain-containing protein n=1 Tax=Achaetomium macrosporum TaxID=79813 RepID=A0AAN7CG18_9PEZI|nr:mitochondrial ribosomal protein subunit L20-domain-containing protein [Achaetomium macrosporum]
MEAIAARPAVSCCRSAVAAGTGPRRLLLNTTSAGARQKSSSARTRRALNIPPHQSFLGFNSGSDGATRPTSDEIIFNPPSSAPSVFHTPFKFLPPSDPRRRANLASELFASSTHNPSSTSPLSSASASEATPSPEDLPLAGGVPPLKPRHHLTKEDIEEMRRLRAEDPVKNSVLNLSRQFQCSKLFVLMCCQAPKEHREKIKSELEQVKARWGPRRRAAREERHRRFAMLFNGEL